MAAVEVSQIQHVSDQDLGANVETSASDKLPQVSPDDVNLLLGTSEEAPIEQEKQVPCEASLSSMEGMTSMENMGYDHGVCT